MEIEHYYEWLSPYTALQYDSTLMTDFRNFLKSDYARGYDFADYVVMNFPDPRIEYYQDSDYDNVQEKVVGYTNKLVNDLGFFPESVNCVILEELQNLSLALVFLGIIFSIVAILFVIISILLIYSLLMVTVEEKSFEVGIYRMVGLNKYGLVSMVLLKAFFFVIPAIIAGFLLSSVFLWLIYTLLFNAVMGTEMQPVPSVKASFYALAIGLIIPLLSSIYPMKIILSKTLTDALSYSSSKTKAVFVQIIHAKDFDRKPYIIFGVLSVVYGLSIYYFLPLSLISMNFSLLLAIFFLILIGMFVGLVLLALNLQRVLEIFFVYLFLFYERTSTRMLVLKNMIAHKQRNRSTILIYAMSVGFLIMIVVAYNLEIQNSTAITQLEQGHYLYFRMSTYGSLTADLVEAKLKPVEELIDYLAYETWGTKTGNDIEGYDNMLTSDHLQLIELKTNLYGITPFFEETLMKKYLKIDKENSTTDLSYSEQLYTARGVQGIGMPGYIRQRLDLSPNDWNETFRTSLYTSKWNVYMEQRCLWSTMLFPGKNMLSRANDEFGYDIVSSVPTYNQLLGIKSGDMKGHSFRLLGIKLKNPSNSADINEVKTILGSIQANAETEIYDFQTDSGNLEDAALILDIIFNVIIASVMFLCYFALSSATTANMMEQTKEIGVLRAIGMRKARVYFLYLYETFIMIFTG